MRPTLHRIAFVLALGAVLLLAACGGSQPGTPAAGSGAELQQDPPFPSETSYPAPGGIDSALDSGTTVSSGAYPGPGVNLPVIVAQGNPTPYPEPGSGELPSLPTGAPVEATATSQPTRVVKQELQASDPSAVQLASGKLQLIEFFAFW